jgi:mRNA interferase MazF
VPIGGDEGLEPAGVVRLGLPYEGRIFCTWQITLATGHLVERVGALSPEKMRRLDAALRLAAGVSG